MRLLRLVLVAGALLATACGGDEEAAPPASPSGTTSVRAEREPAPAIAGRTLQGDRLALADFRGKPVLINVWSSW